MKIFKMRLELTRVCSLSREFKSHWGIYVLWRKQQAVNINAYKKKKWENSKKYKSLRGPTYLKENIFTYKCKCVSIFIYMIICKYVWIFVIYIYICWVCLYVKKNYFYHRYIYIYIYACDRRYHRVYFRFYDRMCVRSSQKDIKRMYFKPDLWCP